MLAGLGFLLGALPAPATVEEQSALAQYSATHTMLVNSEESSNATTAVSPNQVALLATAGEVPKRVAEQIGYSGSPASLAAQVVVMYDFSTGALTFETTQATAESAVEIADAFADNLNAYLIERQDQIYQDRLATSLDRLDELEAQLNDLTEELATAAEDPVLIAQRDAISRQYSVAFEQNQTLTEAPAVLAFTTLERAQAIEQSTESGGLSAPSSRWVRGLMGLVVGVVAGIGVVVLLGLFDRRIRTREQAEAVMGTRARVMIPKVKAAGVGGPVVTSGRHDPLSDAYRTLRNVVGFVQSGLEPVDRARITMVVSPGPAEGKTSLATNLACALAESGQKTVVVDADFRRPRLARAITGASVPKHLFTIDEIDSLEVDWLLSETQDPNLSILDLTAMAPASELAFTTAKLLPRVAQSCDAVVVDTSPLGSTAEPLELVPIADVIIIVARLGHTNVDTAERTASILRDLTTVPILLVLTGVTGERAGYYEYTDRRRAGLTRGWSFRRRKPYMGPERRHADGPSLGRRFSDLPDDPEVQDTAIELDTSTAAAKRSE